MGIISNSTRWVGKKVTTGVGAIFHYVGAAGNVFWMNQMRFMRWFGHFFQSTSGLKVLAHFGMFLTPPAVLQFLREFSVRGRNAQLQHIRAGSLSEEELAQSLQEFHGSYSHLTDAIDAGGHGLKMTNALPLFITLFNVYSGRLDEHGAIESDYDWGVYVTVSITSFLCFMTMRYNDNRTETEKLLRAYITELNSKITAETEHEAGDLVVNAPAGERRLRSIWASAYAADKDPQHVLDEVVQGLQTSPEQQSLI